MPVILLFPFFVIFSFFFQLLCAARRGLYRQGLLASYRPGARVVSVGNITLGGSGKTPMVAFLAGFFSGQGRHPVVLLRGYKKPRGMAASAPEKDFYALGDEGSWLKESLKGRAGVLAGKDRVALARGLDSEKKCDVIILDDGFQHLALKRDVDIVMVDAKRPFGNSWILPAGPLREFPAALRRADILCVSRVDEADAASVEAVRDRLWRINPDALIIESVHKPSGLVELATGREKPLDVLSGEPVGIFCGIGNPASFEKSVMEAGAVILKRCFFEDHHVYSPVGLARLFREGSRDGVKVWVTTEKDAQRLTGLKTGDTVVLVFKVTLAVIKGYEELRGRLSAL